MKHGHDDDPRFIDVIEKGVRESMKKDSAEGSMNDLEREWSLLRQGNRFIESANKVVR